MPLDYEALLFAPAYAVFGVTGTITTVRNLSAPLELDVKDETAGYPTQEADGEGGTVLTVRPAAICRMADITRAGFSRADLRRATLEMNDKTYRIDGTLPVTTPAGEATGELVLFLTEIS